MAHVKSIARTKKMDSGKSIAKAQSQETYNVGLPWNLLNYGGVSHQFSRTKKIQYHKHWELEANSAGIEVGLSMFKPWYLQSKP